MSIVQEVGLISEARQAIALDQGNDHLLHYGWASIPLVCGPEPSQQPRDNVSA